MSISACLPCTSRTTPSRPSRANRHPHARLDRRLGLAARRLHRRPGSFLQPADHLLDGRSGVRTSRAGLSRADRRGGAPRCLIRQRRGARFQAFDDRVDLTTAGAQLFIQLGVEPAPIRLLSLAHRVLARSQLSSRSRRPPPVSRATSRRSCSSRLASSSTRARCSASCFSRSLRFSRAAATTDGGHAQPRGDLDGQAAPWRSVDASEYVGANVSGLKPNAALSTPSVVEAYDFSES